jgi:hypothetical protein
MSSEVVMRLIVKFSLSRRPVIAAHQGRSTCAAMAASSYFTAFAAPIGAAEKEFDKLDGLVTEAAAHGQKSSPEIRKQMTVCMGQAAILRSIVQQTADADLANAALIIAAATMGSKKRPTRKPRADIGADWGDLSGQVLLSTKCYGRAAYRWQMSADGSTWSDIRITMQSDTVVDGLTAGTTYWFRVQVTTVHGERDPSRAVHILVK